MNLIWSAYSSKKNLCFEINLECCKGCMILIFLKEKYGINVEIHAWKCNFDRFEILCVIYILCACDTYLIIIKKNIYHLMHAITWFFNKM